MNYKILFCVIAFVSMNSICSARESLPLPRSTPEEQGIPSSAILSFVKAADAQIDAMHSFMLVRHGKVVSEGWWKPYGPEIPHTMFSLSKSFTSTAVGLAIADGKLSLDDPVLKFFPEDMPPNPSDNLKAMRVRDLLIMSSGQLPDVVSSFKFDTNIPLTKEFLSLPVDLKPGTLWFYSTPGSYMLSAIVQKVTGQTVLDYLRPRLFEPLGIENPTWEMSPQGISLGGYGLHLKTEDIARFGLLYLHKGQWQGKQLVPASWVAAATSRQTANGSNPRSDWEQGYGYQFWQCRNGVYRGDGAFGQFCIVMPEQDAVVVMTAGTTNMAGMLNLVWENLRTAMQAGPLTPIRFFTDSLTNKLANLTMRAIQVTGEPGPAMGMSGRRFLFPSNDQHIEAVSLRFQEGPNVGREPPHESATLRIRLNGVDQMIRCGGGAWAAKTGPDTYGSSEGGWSSSQINFVSDVMNPPAEQPVAANGAWTGEGIYTAKLVFYETPFTVTINLRFAGDRLFYNAEYNVVRRQPAKLPGLTGHAE